MEHFQTYGFPKTEKNEKDLLGLIEWKEIEGATLEIGCGTGRFLRQFKLHGKKIIGADSSWNMVNISSKYSLVAKTDGKNLPFSDNYFDNILIHGVLHHNKNWKEILEEALRVWNKKGFLIVGIAKKYSWFYYFRKYKPNFIKISYWMVFNNLTRQLADWFNAPYYFIEDELRENLKNYRLREISRKSLGAMIVFMYEGK